MNERTRQLIKQETNIELLKELLLKTFEYTERVQKDYQAEVDRRAKLAQQKFNVDEQYLILKKKFFGKSSEKTPIQDRLRGEMESDIDLLAHSQSLVPKPNNKQTKELEKQVLEYECTPEELKEMSESLGLESPSADQWEKMEGFYERSKEVTVVERSYKQLLHRKQKYQLKKQYQQGDKTHIITAEGPKKLLPGCGYSPEFAVSVVSDKYINHMPLTRQLKQMESLGLKKLQAKTLYNLCWAVGEHLNPLVEKIKEEIKSQPTQIVHADETPWPINNKDQSDGYMWVLSNQAGSYYQYEPTRSGKVIKEILKGYEGPVMSDGFSGYNRVNNSVYCWAHVRRKFFDLQDSYPEEAKEILAFLRELFFIETKAKTLSELKELRQTESKVIIDKIKHWSYEHYQKARPESGLRKAINYMLKLWDGLTEFIKDARVPLTNNEAERTIRHAVMGRKNFYGSRTINGADLTATFYTIIESCKKVELDPRDYIQKTLKSILNKEDVKTPLQTALAQRS